MKIFITIWIFFTITQITSAQKHNIQLIELPQAFNSELEISGLVGHNDSLYFISEREKIVFVVNRKNYSLHSTISLTQPILHYNSLNPENEINIRTIEMEGITWHNGNLLLVDEGNTALYLFQLRNNTIEKMQTDINLSEFTGSRGMEGIAINTTQKLVYILRERNGNNQTEIYTFKIVEENLLNYLQKFTIDHDSNNWRYSDIYFDQDENMLYGLRSFYNHSLPETAKCYVDQIPVNATGFPHQPVLFHNDETLNDSIIQNRCKYVSNLEGIYKTVKKIYLVSDNRHGSKNCNPKPVKTMFIEYILNE